MIESLPLWAEAAASVMLVAGGAFALVGTIGLVRLRDFAMRLHGPTKISTLGIGLLLIASMLIVTVSGGRLAVHELMITLFVFLTAPISAHLLIRAALKSRPDLRPPPPGDEAGGSGPGASAGPFNPGPGDGSVSGRAPGLEGP